MDELQYVLQTVLTLAPSLISSMKESHHLSVNPRISVQDRIPRVSFS